VEGPPPGTCGIVPGVSGSSYPEPPSSGCSIGAVSPHPLIRSIAHTIIAKNNCFSISFIIPTNPICKKLKYYIFIDVFKNFGVI
jgi:hypothetical protein